VSADRTCRAPLTKQTTDLRDDQFLTEIEIFKQLGKLHHTATGLDQVPAWFSDWALPFAPNQSQSSTTHRWTDQLCHYSGRSPISKTKNPTDNSHFRPISITLVLVRVMERMVVRQYIGLYPALNNPPATLTFHDHTRFVQPAPLQPLSLLYYKPCLSFWVRTPLFLFMPFQQSRRHCTARNFTWKDGDVRRPRQRL